MDWKARVRRLPEQAKRIVDSQRAKLASALFPETPAEKRRFASDEEVQNALERFGWFKAPESGAASAKTAAPALRTKPRKGGAAEQPSVDLPVTAPPSASDPKAGSAGAPAEQAHDDRDLFGKKLRRDIMREVFTEEDLALLEDEHTHVYRKQEHTASSEPLNGEEETVVVSRRREENRSGAKKAETPEKPAKLFTERDYRPIRRSRSYRTGLQGGLMYFGFVVCVSVILASLMWLAADDVLSLNKDEVEAQIFVGEDVSLDAVASELYSKGIVKYKPLFRLFGKLTHAEEKIEPGIYTISSKLDYNAMIHVMKHDEVVYVERETVKVTIPEGKTLKQTFQILAEHGVCPYETLLDCAANHAFKYSFLSELPYGDATRLEGYLFPDTYEFYAPSKPEEAINKFLLNFDGKFSQEMRDQAAEMGYSVHEIVTVSSLVEMEAGSDSERGTIASVIYNRLNSSYYPYLQIDATIQYALEERKEFLTEKDLAVDSPYNTYKYTGIPPGPIANPGLASLRSALNPENTGYYFYALNKSGVHNFFSSYTQFEAFKNSEAFGG